MEKNGQIVFVDTEVDADKGIVLDYGAVSKDGLRFHDNSSKEFAKIIHPFRYLCGHNILKHDLKFIENIVPRRQISENVIDTLCLSPLLFPNKPYHALLKDDKLQVDELNNPLNDAQKCMELFFDEVNAFLELNQDIQEIMSSLLRDTPEFKGFFHFFTEAGIIRGDESLLRKYINRHKNMNELGIKIQECFEGKICANAKLTEFVRNNPVELSYCLSLIAQNDGQSIIPHWVHRTFPVIELVMRKLRSIPCQEGCSFCKEHLDVRIKLNQIFGYGDFRTYEGEALQEKAVRAAMQGESLLAIFPTGGGKSLTFQLPALIQGEYARSLTVVISPLQSLMKDQVDNLEKRGIADAVSINGLLSPIERAESIERVENGIATILYISPEQLRSRTIERILLGRNIARFVIDDYEIIGLSQEAA